MKINEDTVKKIAVLSKISLSEAETEEFTGQLEKILVYMDKLDKLDTSDVSPTSHVGDMNNVLRADEPEPSPGTDKILANAPDRYKNYFKVPGIIDETQ